MFSSDLPSHVATQGKREHLADQASVGAHFSQSVSKLHTDGFNMKLSKGWSWDTDRSKHLKSVKTHHPLEVARWRESHERGPKMSCRKQRNAHQRLKKVLFQCYHHETTLFCYHRVVKMHCRGLTGSFLRPWHCGVSMWCSARKKCCAQKKGLRRERVNDAGAIWNTRTS